MFTRRRFHVPERRPCSNVVWLFGTVDHLTKYSLARVDKLLNVTPGGSQSVKKGTPVGSAHFINAASLRIFRYSGAGAVKEGTGIAWTALSVLRRWWIPASIVVGGVVWEMGFAQREV